jgi:hypothetical protein
MSSAIRIVGMRRDDMAARHGIRIKSRASSIRRWVACKANSCPDDRICSRLN